MLRIFKSLQTIDFGQLMTVYNESNMENAAEMYPNEESNVALINVEQSFYSYIKDDFFHVDCAFYGVWEHHGGYVSALRMEPYRDGWLLEALETAPNHRKRGYAKALINSVIVYLSERGSVKVYSHVNKMNLPSLVTHEACGFKRILEHAVYIDGSVMTNSCTLLYCAMN